MQRELVADGLPRTPEAGWLVHVLIADNDVAVSSLLTDVLVRLGLSVRHAFDGEIACRMARDAAVGVLICDLDMPKVPGLEVLESLASLSKPPQSIVVSGYLDSMVQERLACLPYVREVLRKPFDLLWFADRVRALVVELERAAAASSGLSGQGAVAVAPNSGAVAGGIDLLRGGDEKCVHGP